MLFSQGEFAVKLEIEQVSHLDKGTYKLVARNEKGEATSQVVEITEIPEEGDRPKFAAGLKSTVSKDYSDSLLSSSVRSSSSIFILSYHRPPKKVRPSNSSRDCPRRTKRSLSYGLGE